MLSPPWETTDIFTDQPWKFPEHSSFHWQHSELWNSTLNSGWDMRSVGTCFPDNTAPASGYRASENTNTSKPPQKIAAVPGTWENAQVSATRLQEVPGGSLFSGAIKWYVCFFNRCCLAGCVAIYAQISLCHETLFGDWRHGSVRRVFPM